MLDDEAVEKFEKRIVDKLAAKFTKGIILGAASLLLSLATAAYAVGILSERVATTSMRVEEISVTTKALVDRNERIAVLEAMQAQQTLGLKEIRDDVKDLVNKLDDVLGTRRRSAK